MPDPTRPESSRPESRTPESDPPGFDSSAPDAVDRRLTDLEIKATYADDLLDQLNQTIYRQQAEIDQLARALKALREQMPDLENRAGPGLLDEVPPHY